ncbi:hypothetical protein GCM10027445_33380 [Amycolatopsis endophytica]|uniref:Uncharacterized protein n=1 Tax=Amycolatopsis endophytica TaxID=860233 RepID=A0A853B0U1_9PSEU|nr:hypothetical protein [Amycolatopsis endophytica]NYI88401.1 hypothetical protein [Amycolatopsis endophytica]
MVDWHTVRTERTVLVIVHNTTAATRLFDILPLFATDPRIQTVFTCPGSSAFTAGTHEYLAKAGIEVLPWETALRMPADLAISASYGGGLHDVAAPLMVVPHGMGYNKYLESEGRGGVFGLSGEWLTHDGRVVPSVIVLSHEEQLDRLIRACPEAAANAIVAGDPCFDRMLASLPLRESYRQAFGLEPGQRLIVVSSTWGDASLFGSDPELVRRLAATLDLDGYRLAVALHPNITAHHSPWQVRIWLEDCRRAGVLVLPDEQWWGAALVAADLTVGDHGSVSFYSAALGLPLLLAAAPENAVAPDSPIAGLLAAAPRLGADPRRQIDEAIKDHDPATLAAITGLTTSLPGGSNRTLSDAIYRRLRLRSPGEPETRALPIPEADIPEPRAHLVRIRSWGDHAEATRFPAVALREPGRAPRYTHLVVDTREPSARLLDLADIVVHDHPRDARRWVGETLRSLTGCSLAVARDGDTWLAGDGDGFLVRLSDLTGPAPVFAAALQGHPGGAEIRVELGGTLRTATVTVLR